MKFFWFIGSLLYAIGQTVSMILFSVLGQFTRPFSFQTRYAFMHYWARFCLTWLRWTCGLRYKVHGMEHVDETQPGLILSRHESAWETLAFQQIFPRQAYVLKRELLKIPFFGWGMKLLHPIAIDRSAGRQALNQLLSEGQARLKQGDWIVLFPEGTRMPPGQIGKINVGGAMLAKKVNCPIYLVAHNAGSYWPKNSFIKRPGLIEMHISPPLDVSEMSVAEINQAIEDWYSRFLEKPDNK
ncbi:lysophospholipid acyltransferase family protein [Thiomicrorhabdus sp. ZW0627]|uniref:lysophospholipid acyltransferase family protein n=1 Tax=Thiomicrorhabdus sp. ZW0627 TaxID=3039774 RepID=UPI00243655F7|nr:lysophospholipid acyltransferase family protein [Thiomicrorhabdus sp. ZW0627]MDG6774804.1 lysophospholipid acyltransferase family protein [Thiomicrorhabdus sp. ZW0627]